MPVVRNLMTRFGADADPFVKGTKKAEKAMKGYTASMQSAGKALKSTIGALGVGLSFGALVSGAKEAYTAYTAQAEVETKLAAVMRNTMGAAQSEVQSVLDLASAQQRLGVIGDEVQLAGAQELATYLEMSDSLKTLIPVMNDMVAQQYGISASAEQAANIATMLGKVMQGQTGGLSRYGYYFTEAQKAVLKYGDEAERAAMLSQIVGESVGGVNAALAQTDIGRMQQLKNTIGDVKEQFGQAASNLAQSFLPAISKMVDGLSRLAQWAITATSVLRQLFTGQSGQMQVAISGAASSLSEAADDTATGVGGAAKKLEKATASFDKLNILKTSNSSGSGGGGSSSLAADTFETSGGKSGTDFMDDMSVAAENLRARLQPLSDGFGTVKQAISNLWNSTAFAAFREYAKKDATSGLRRGLEMFGGDLQTLGGGIELVSGLLNGDPDSLSKAVESIRSGLTRMFPSWEKFQNYLQFAQNPVGFLGQKLGDLAAKGVLAGMGIKTGADTGKSALGVLSEYVKNNTAFGQWFTTKVQPWFTAEKWAGLWGTAKTGISNGIRAVLRAIQADINLFIDILNSMAHVEWDGLNVAGKQIIKAGSFTLFSIPHLQAFAGGGFPTAGSVFLAGESGPEMVGTMGGRTAVANNSQIVGGIRQGVSDANLGVINAIYEAVRELRAEIRENGDVYIDGNKATDEITRRQERKRRQGSRSVVMT